MTNIHTRKNDKKRDKDVTRKKSLERERLGWKRIKENGERKRRDWTEETV